MNFINGGYCNTRLKIVRISFIDKRRARAQEELQTNLMQNKHYVNLFYYHFCHVIQN